MAKNKVVHVAIACCSVVAVVLSAASFLRPQKLDFDLGLSNLNDSLHGNIPSGLTAEGEKQLSQAWVLWQHRGKRDISNELLPLLDKPDFQIREFAVRALSKLESPAAERPIANLRVKQQQELQAYLNARRLYESRRNSNNPIMRWPVESRQISELTLRMALARIHSRNLKGQAKVEAISKEIGIPWPKLVEGSHTINGKYRFYAYGSVGSQVIREIVDVLYTMKRRGEDINGVASDLILNPTQKIRLKGAALPEKEEAELLLDYVMPMRSITAETMPVSDYLCMLGQPAVEPVLSRLQDMKDHPQTYENTHGYGLLFLAADSLADPRVLPLLRHFENSKTNRVGHYARQSRIPLEQNLKRKKPLPPNNF